jgi:hypothetical protein
MTTDTIRGLAALVQLLAAASAGMLAAAYSGSLILFVAWIVVSFYFAMTGIWSLIGDEGLLWPKTWGKY